MRVYWEALAPGFEWSWIQLHGGRNQVGGLRPRVQSSGLHCLFDVMAVHAWPANLAIDCGVGLIRSNLTSSGGGTTGVFPKPCNHQPSTKDVDPKLLCHEGSCTQTSPCERTRPASKTIKLASIRSWITPFLMI